MLGIWRQLSSVCGQLSRRFRQLTALCGHLAMAFGQLTRSFQQLASSGTPNKKPRSRQWLHGSDESLCELCFRNLLFSRYACDVCAQCFELLVEVNVAAVEMYEFSNTGDPFCNEAG